MLGSVWGPQGSPRQREPRDTVMIVGGSQGIRGETGGAGPAQLEMRRQRGSNGISPFPKGSQSCQGRTLTV